MNGYSSDLTIYHKRYILIMAQEVVDASVSG